MASKHVKSPAGETVEIVDDDDWVMTAGVTLRSIVQWSGNKPYLLRALWEHGEFTNESGQTARAIHEYIMANYHPDVDLPNFASMSMLMGEPQNAPAFDRVLKGKRTFRVKLIAMPEIWHRKLMWDIGPGQPSTNGDHAAAEPVAALVMPQDSGEELSEADWESLKMDAPTVFDEPPPLDIHIAHQVAMSMLTAVVEIISAGSADTSKLAGSQRLQQDLVQVQELLSQRLQENQKLRTQVREAGDMISALKLERDGLRTRLRMTEHNLTEALKGETAQAVNTEIMKRVDQIMRTAPGTPKGD